jgi:hypothetical protein
MVPAAPSRMVWRVLQCPSKQGTSSLCCSCAFSACWVGEFYLVLNFNQVYITFVWLYVSWFLNQGGYGLVAPYEF